MKKTTILIIFIVYLASIVVIGFFGMRTKVYDEIKYVRTIEIQADQADSTVSNQMKFTDTGKDKFGYNTYKLELNFDNALIREFERKDGIKEQRKYIGIIFTAFVTYDTDEVAGSAESITYTLSESGTRLQNMENIVFESNGKLTCFKPGVAFTIYVKPASQSGAGIGSIISVFT